MRPWGFCSDLSVCPSVPHYWNRSNRRKKRGTQTAKNSPKISATFFFMKTICDSHRDLHKVTWLALSTKRLPPKGFARNLVVEKTRFIQPIPTMYDTFTHMYLTFLVNVAHIPVPWILSKCFPLQFSVDSTSLLGNPSTNEKSCVDGCEQYRKKNLRYASLGNIFRQAQYGYIKSSWWLLLSYLNNSLRQIPNHWTFKISSKVWFCHIFAPGHIFIP